MRSHLVLALLVAAGCGDGTLSTGGPPATAEAACNQLFGSLITKMGACGQPFRPVDMEQIRYVCGRLQGVVDSGAAIYDKSFYNDCKAAFDNITCTAPLPSRVPACLALLRGT